MKKKGNKKMPRPRQEIIDNPTTFKETARSETSLAEPPSGGGVVGSVANPPFGGVAPFRGSAPYIFVYVLCSCSVVCGYWGCNFKNICKCVATPLKNKDVGIGLSMISCLGLGIFLFPFFFMK